MDDIVVIEAAQHMQDGIRLPDIRKELVSKSFPTGSTFHQAGDIHNFHRGGNGAFGLANIREHLQPLVGHVGGTHVRVDGTKREIGALGFPGTYAVK